LRSRRASLSGTLRQDELDPGEVAPRFAEQARVFELPGVVLHTVGEQVLFELHAELTQVLGAALAEVLGFHLDYSVSRARTRVSSGNLAAARRNASRASFSGTPAISNRMRPGFTTATQPSTAPL